MLHTKESEEEYKKLNKHPEFSDPNAGVNGLYDSTPKTQSKSPRERIEGILRKHPNGWLKPEVATDEILAIVREECSKEKRFVRENSAFEYQDLAWNAALASIIDFLKK